MSKRDSTKQNRLWVVEEKYQGQWIVDGHWAVFLSRKEARAWASEARPVIGSTRVRKYTSEAA